MNPGIDADPDPYAGALQHREADTCLEIPKVAVPCTWTIPDVKPGAWRNRHGDVLLNWRRRRYIAAIKCPKCRFIAIELVNIDLIALRTMGYPIAFVGILPQRPGLPISKNVFAVTPRPTKNIRVWITSYPERVTLPLDRGSNVFIEPELAGVDAWQITGCKLDLLKPGTKTPCRVHRGNRE